jgi:predicted nuclease with TOPRIM domain
MKKGFRDIEEYFLQAEARRIQEKTKKPPQKNRENLINQIKNLNEKLKGKDRKIKELYGEISTLRSQIEELKKEKETLELHRREIRKLEDYRNRIDSLVQEVAQLKGELAEKEKKIESLKAAEIPKPRVELFIEVALNSLSSIVAGKNNLKVLFSKRFRKDMVKEVSIKPFLLESFISALSRIDTTSRLLKRDKKDIYRIRVTSPYGEFRAIYTKISSDTIKFHRFGPRETIYEELNSSKWSLD